MIQCRNNHIVSIITRIYWLICIVYVVTESTLLLYISFANGTRAIANAQPASTGWHLLSYILIACIALSNIVYLHDSAKSIFADIVSKKQKKKPYIVIILKIAAIFIAEIIVTITPFIISQI